MTDTRNAPKAPVQTSYRSRRISVHRSHKLLWSDPPPLHNVPDSRYILTAVWPPPGICRPKHPQAADTVLPRSSVLSPTLHTFPLPSKSSRDNILSLQPEYSPVWQIHTDTAYRFRYRQSQIVRHGTAAHSTPTNALWSRPPFPHPTGSSWHTLWSSLDRSQTPPSKYCSSSACPHNTSVPYRWLSFSRFQGNFHTAPFWRSGAWYIHCPQTLR